MKHAPRRLPALAVGAVATLATALLAPTAHAAPAPGGVSNPYSPAYGHAYRHGVIPTLEVHAKMQAWAAAHESKAAPQTLSYGGGVAGIGVNSGHSKVYLVFYGSQWGTARTASNGIMSFTGDAKHGAPAAQKMFKNIGKGGEKWSAELTQWCDGPNVPTGATSCPANANFIPYQQGGVLSGVWYDNSAPSPAAASAAQLGQEAVKAAQHFGNTANGKNRNAYYVILSPHGTNPDNYFNHYCAWHDWTGDVGINSPYGPIAFSNQPYNMDMGASCGVGILNSPGTLDGWTVTLGHEWQEMMSDQTPAGGWTNHTGSQYNGQENSDECAWITSGQGAIANIQLGNVTFAEQSSWSNDTNRCDQTHAILH